SALAPGTPTSRPRTQTYDAATPAGTPTGHHHYVPPCARCAYPPGRYPGPTRRTSPGWRGPSPPTLSRAAPASTSGTGRDPRPPPAPLRGPPASTRRAAPCRSPLVVTPATVSLPQ